MHLCRHRHSRLGHRRAIAPAVLEEFGVAVLPCFRYLVIETKRDSRADDGFLPHRPEPHERVDLIPITIPDLRGVQRTPSLDAWLDPRTLERKNERGYEEGVGHRRQAGRLCLWENWPRVRDAIIQTVEGVNTSESRTRADWFLRENYFVRKPSRASLPADSLVDAVPRVYLVGTLCGGTCSGTFLDLAFFFRSLLDARNRSNLRDLGRTEIVGLFTIPDSIYIRKEKSLPHVVSCWAALLELDFYTKEETVYEVQFPNQPPFKTPEPPFTTAYLVSKRNTGRMGFTEDDLEGLHQMCAMNLFTEVVAGMASVKAGNRTNLPASGSGFFKTNASGYIRAFSSLGLSAMWYPRYRITKAICRRLGEEMANDWLGNKNFQPGKIEETLRAEWQASLEWATGSLLGTVGKANCPVHLPNVVAQLFDRRESEFKAASRDGLEALILNFPGGETTMAQRLNPGGEYYRHVAAAMTLLTPDLRSRLGDMVAKYLRQHTFTETRHYLKTLEDWIKAKEESISPELPPYSQKQDLSRASEVHGDRATWALGLRRDAIKEYKEGVWDRFRQHTLRHLEHLREHFLKQALANVRGDVVSLRLQIEAAETKLTTLRNACVREREELVTCPHSSNIVILSEGKPDSIADDVALSVATILQSTSLDELRRNFLSMEAPQGPATMEEQDPIEVFESRHEALMAFVERAYQRKAQDRVADFKIGRVALHAAAARIKDMVFASSPYFEPSSGLSGWKNDMVPPQTPNFLFCGDDEASARLVEEAKRHTSSESHAKFISEPSPLDHFIFFYQETLGLALSDFTIAEFAAQQLEAEESNPENREPTRYSHKLGRHMFDPRAIEDTARQWVRDTQELAPELFQTLEGQVYLDYRAADHTSRDVYVNDEASVRDFIRDNGLEAFIRLLAERLASLGRVELVQRIDKRKHSAQTREKREALAARHEEILMTVFPPPA